jgi:hypothetical protein
VKVLQKGVHSGTVEQTATDIVVGAEKDSEDDEVEENQPNLS